MTDPLQQENSPVQPARTADADDMIQREPSFKESPPPQASPEPATVAAESAAAPATRSGDPTPGTAGAMSFSSTLRFAATVGLVCVGVFFLGRTVVSHVERHIPSNITSYVHGLFGSNQTCYRTIDMQRLTARMVADLLTKTNGKSADEAAAFYKSRVHEMDEAINAVADQCVLLRRDAVVSAPADIDVTAEIASRLGLDLNGAPSAPAGINALQAPASVANTPVPASGADAHAASDAAGNPKLDE